MKKSLVLSLIFLCGIAFSLSSCKSDKIGGNIIKDGEKAKTEGWIDEDTFRMAGMGASPIEENDPFVRKAMSKEAATIDAQVKIIEKFTGAKVQGAAGVKNFRLSGFAAAKEIEGAIKGGSVYNVEWDKETQDCVVIYEVKAKGLQKKVKSADIK
jgi:hypothetical protein